MQHETAHRPATPERSARRPRPALGLAGLALVLALGGCSIAGTAYSNLDWLLTEYAEDYFELREAQEEWLAGEIRHWQSEAAPRFLELADAYLADSRTAVAGRLEAPRVSAAVDSARRLIATTLDSTLPVLAQLLASLDQTQRTQLEEGLRRANEEYREEHLAPDPRRRLQQRIDTVVERLERLTGGLYAPQRELVAAHVRGWPELAAGWLEYRSERQQALLALLRQGATVQQVQSMLHAWLVERAGMPVALDAARSRVQQDFARLVTRLHATLDQDQRAHLLAAIDRYRDWVAAMRRA